MEREEKPRRSRMQQHAPLAVYEHAHSSLPTHTQSHRRVFTILEQESHLAKGRVEYKYIVTTVITIEHKLEQ